MKISAGKHSSFAIKGQWSTWWDQHMIYSVVWIFWLAYGLNQCSKENCDFSFWHAIVCHFSCFLVFTSESGNLILCIERIVSLRWGDKFLRGKYCKQKELLRPVWRFISRCNSHCLASLFSRSAEQRPYPLRCWTFPHWAITVDRRQLLHNFLVK